MIIACKSCDGDFHALRMQAACRLHACFVQATWRLHAGRRQAAICCIKLNAGYASRTQLASRL